MAAPDTRKPATRKVDTMNRRLLAGLASVAATAGVLAMTGVPASAHVTIDTLGVVEQGEFGKLGFSVPNERDDAGTVGLRVQMPQDEPIAYVSVQAKPGWTVTTTMRTLDTPIEVFGATLTEVVDTITWTADEGTQINPGEFDWFWISVGPLPTDADSLTFPAIQTYSSGEEVAWIEPANPDGSEPEHPAPTVELAPAGGAESPAGTTVGTTA
jgi:uncharacterized protein YcnI